MAFTPRHARAGCARRPRVRTVTRNVPWQPASTTPYVGSSRTAKSAASHSGVLAPLLGIPHDGLPAPASEPADVYELHARWPAWLWPSLRLAFGEHDMFGWYARDPARMLARDERAGRAVPPLFVDVGVDDPFLEENRSFVEQARAHGASVVYHEWQREHDSRNWRDHTPQSLICLASHDDR